MEKHLNGLLIKVNSLKLQKKEKVSKSFLKKGEQKKVAHLQNKLNEMENQKNIQEYE